MTAPDANAVRIGQRYRIEDQIGVGAMGRVWRATDELLNRPVAVKELLAVSPGTSPAEIEESRQRILREGRIGARLQHAHVISMFDVVIHEDRPWLVMEYLPSDSLAAVVADRGPLPAAEVAAIGWQVADGLAAAHRAGVVHRDVKPGNVLIAPDGRVKITDFGVSRAVDDVQLTRTGLIAGTPAFLSPEVAQGKDPTAASDVFALGATLYAAVEGAPPFGLDDNAYALLHKVATAEPTPPQRAWPLTGVLMRLLAVDPEGRPTAAQARDLLATVAGGGEDATTVASGPAGAPPTRTALPPAAPARRRWTPVVTGVLLGSAVLLGGAAALVTSENIGGPAAPLTPPATSAVAPPAVTSAPAASSAPVVAAPAAPAPTTSTRPPAATTSTATGDAVAFVERYYALLPGDTDAAFALLGPQARTQSGGQQAFAAFWGEMQDVSLQNARNAGGGAVNGTVRFVRKDGRTSNEAYRFVIGTGGSGRTVMESFSRGG